MKTPDEGTHPPDRLLGSATAGASELLSNVQPYGWEKHATRRFSKPSGGSLTPWESFCGFPLVRLAIGVFIYSFPVNTLAS